MPQLDRLAYVSQVIWLVVMFFVIYLVLVKTGLPKLYKILRFRQDKLFLLNENVIKAEREVFFIGQGSKTVVQNVVQTMKPVLDGVVKIVENNLEDRKLAERRIRSQVREVLVFNARDVISDLVVCKLIDENEYVKKGRVEKKVIGN